MGLLSKLTDFVGGSLFKEAKGLIQDYWPPEVSPEKRAEFDLRLQELEARKTQEMAVLANEQLKLELADTQSAREAHKLSIMPAVITIMLTIMVCGLLWAIIYTVLPEGSKDLAFALFGQVFTLWGASVGYWVGTTRSSQEKSAIIAKSSPVT